jgi:hypothetical protein
MGKIAVQIVQLFENVFDPIVEIVKQCCYTGNFKLGES